MKSFTIVMLATAGLAFPALAEQQYRGQVSSSPGQQQDRQDPAWRGEQTRQRIKAADLSSGQIRKIQRSLKDAGHDIDVDGKWGPNTRQAVKRFQQDKGMAATGQLNRRVIDAMGLDSRRFAADDYLRDNAPRPLRDRSYNAGSERGRHYGYSGRDRDYGYSGRDRRRSDDYSPRRGERY